MTVKKKVDKMLSHFVTPPFLVQIRGNPDRIEKGKRTAPTRATKSTHGTEQIP